MNNLVLAIFLGLGFSLSAFAQTAPITPVSSDSVPILPKVWTGVAGDSSIGAISRKNPLHYLHVGEANQVKGWNVYGGPATITILKQEGRHLDIQFKNPKYQINQVGTLSADGKQIQITSKEATGLFTIEGNKISGCGVSQGTDGLFDHWLGSYSAWCDEYTVGTTAPPSSTNTVATLPKVWTGNLSATNFGGPTRHVPNHEANIGKDRAVKGWTVHDESPRTITIIRQEGRHVEFIYKSHRAESKFIGMLSADGKQMQVTTGFSSGIWNIEEGKIAGCAVSRGMDGSFTHWFNNYQAYCVDFIVGTSPPATPQSVPILPKEWQGKLFVTSLGATDKFNPKHADNVGKENESQDWNAYDAPITLSIIRQEGRHFEIVHKHPNPRGEISYVGTLSADGKLLQIAGKNYEYFLNLAGDTLSGCGNGRGSDGTFASWKDKYSAVCFTFTAVR
jgi:hypothetical protein